MMADFLTPLLADDSPLDAHGREIVTRLFRAEQALMAALPTDDPRDPKRLHRVKLTHAEMFGQPEAIRATWQQERDAIDRIAASLAAYAFDRVVLTGCGDSLAVMHGVRLLLETMLQVPCEPVQALDLAYYQAALLGPRTLVMCLSSSGTTTRTVEALLMARARGAITLALSNTPGSILMQEATHGLLIHAQRKGWPTQSSTAAMALLGALAVRIGALRNAAAAGECAQALEAVPALMQTVLSATDPIIRELARSLSSRPIYLYAGGGPAYAAAMFGATKMKECSPDHAMAIQLEEFHHYNSQKAGDPLFVLAPAGPSVARARDTAEEGKRWKGGIYALVTESEPALDACSDRVMRLPAAPEYLSAFLFTLPLQLFAYHTALEKFRSAGADIDD
jgi:glucosamine--fructose-6-phosphate aminotransferase (isomerizing)